MALKMLDKNNNDNIINGLKQVFVIDDADDTIVLKIVNRTRNVD